MGETYLFKWMQILLEFTGITEETVAVSHYVICPINTYLRAQLRLGEAAASDIRKGSSRSMFSEPLSSGLAPASQILWGSGALVLRPSLPRQPMCELEGKALSLPPWQEAPSCILNS